MRKVKENPIKELELLVTPLETKDYSGLSEEAREDLLQKKLQEIALHAADNALATMTQIDGVDAVQTVAAMTNTAINLKKAKTSNFSEIPSLETLVALNRALSEPPPKPKE